MLVLRGLRMESKAASAEDIRAAYRQSRPAANQVPDADFRQMLEPQFLAPLDLRRDASWRSVYEAQFTRPKDLDGWLQQGARC